MGKRRNCDPSDSPDACFGGPTRTSEPEPEPEPEQILAPQTSVVVSGLVSASQHNGKSGGVLRYQPKKGRYAVELESGEREAPPLLPEGMT